MFFGISDVKLFLDQITNFVLIQIFHEFNHIFILKHMLDDIVRILPFTVAIPLIEQFPELLPRMVVVADFLEGTIIQGIPVVCINLAIKHAVVIFPANCG